MPSPFDLDILIDTMFMVASAVLFYYALRARRYAERRQEQVFLPYVAYVGLTGFIAGAFEVVGDLMEITLLRAIHALGMFLMSAILIVSIRIYLRNLVRVGKKF